MTVSIAALVPTFNRAHYLRECLQSVLNQTLAPTEIIVIDDGSTDATSETVAEFGPAVTLLSMENHGKAAALNHALSRTTAECVWIVDDDDVTCPDALARLSAALEAVPEAGFSYGRHDRFFDDPETGKREWSDTGYWRECDPKDFLTASMEDMFTHQPGMLVKTDALRQAGLFDENLKRSLDYEMLLRLARIAAGVECPGILFHQRQHTGPRGAGADLFDARHRQQRWIENDQVIFRRIHDSWGLSDFLPRGETLDTPQSERQALIQRGVIMARKKLWSLALSDFSRAASLTDAPLGKRERDIVRRGAQSKYGIDELVDNTLVVDRLVDLAIQNRIGAEITRALADGFKWRIREALQKGHVLTASRLSRAHFALKRPRSRRRSELQNASLTTNP